MKAKVIKNFKRPSSEMVKKFKEIPASIVSDCLNRYSAMNGEIKPIFEGIRVCGPALTIQNMSGNNMMSHLALTFAQPGDVIVIDGRGYLGNAIWGGVQASYAAKRGIAGLVVDGAIRDVEDMRRMKFPVYCKGITPAGPHKGWADSVNVPIQCGSIPVHPGDLIVGDDDGVAVIPLADVESIYQECLERIKKEESWMKKIAQGESSLDAVGLRESLNKMEIEYREE
ncbi:MAG: 4-carboxy-4-hydroxy-2-oxoadipate aldolase/oxaloacetate decarboxylase [Candidatus Omnitrophica bacterium]|nr:4-carboxy-4-hydroxy-2-oxoadipate aldolase/oxaloacetate decarboxylase [Candidatus Omnitrophota bacterium]